MTPYIRLLVPLFNVSPFTRLLCYEDNLDSLSLKKGLSTFRGGRLECHFF